MVRSDPSTEEGKASSNEPLKLEATRRDATRPPVRISCPCSSDHCVTVAAAVGPCSSITALLIDTIDFLLLQFSSFMYTAYIQEIQWVGASAAPDRRFSHAPTSARLAPSPSAFSRNGLFFCDRGVHFFAASFCCLLFCTLLKQLACCYYYRQARLMKARANRRDSYCEKSSGARVTWRHTRLLFVE